MFFLGKLFIFFAEENSTISLRLWSQMILLEKFFICFGRKIMLYSSQCGVRWYFEESFLFSSQKILCCISHVVVLNDIVRKASHFLRTRKFSCMSQVMDLNNVLRKGFYFLGRKNYTAYLRFCTEIVMSGKLFISLGGENSTVYPRLWW